MHVTLLSAEPSVVRSLNLGGFFFILQPPVAPLMQEHRLTMLDFLAYHNSEY